MARGDPRPGLRRGRLQVRRHRDRAGRGRAPTLFAVLLRRRGVWPGVAGGATLTRRDLPAALAGAVLVLVRPRGSASAEKRHHRRRTRRSCGLRSSDRTRCRSRLTWPSSTNADVQSFSYLDDGSIVSLGRSRAVVSALTGEAASSQALAEAIVLSLFGGEVTAAQVTASATAGASPSLCRRQRLGVGVSRAARARAGRFLSAGCEHVARRLGLAVRALGGQRQPPGWTAIGAGERRRLARDADRGSRRASCRERDRGRERAGRCGCRRRRAAASAGKPGPRPRPRPSTPTQPSAPTAPEPDTAGETVRGPAGVPGGQRAALGAGYVFPIFGPVSFGDSFGAPRPGVQGGWHHGEDIFAPEGAGARGRRRHDPHGRLPAPRRIPLLAARHVRERVLQRPPLGVHAARDRGPHRRGGGRDRLRRRHRRCGGRLAAPPLRDPSGGDARARL